MKWEITDMDLMKYADGEYIGGRKAAMIRKALQDPLSNVAKRFEIYEFTSNDNIRRAMEYGEKIKNKGPLMEGGGARTGIRAGAIGRLPPTTAGVASMPEAAGVMRGSPHRMIDPALLRTQPVNPLLQAGRFAKNWGSKFLRSPLGKWTGGIGLGYTLNELLDWEELNNIRTAPKREREAEEEAMRAGQEQAHADRIAGIDYFGDINAVSKKQQFEDEYSSWQDSQMGWGDKLSKWWESR